MTSVVSGNAINLFNQSPMKNDKKRCILFLPVQSSSAGVRRAGKRRGMGWVVVLDLEAQGYG